MSCDLFRDQDLGHQDHSSLVWESLAHNLETFVKSLGRGLETVFNLSITTLLLFRNPTQIWYLWICRLQR